MFKIPLLQELSNKLSTIRKLLAGVATHAAANGPEALSYCRFAKKWRVQACQRGAFVRLIGPNVDPPVWDCPAFGATTITEAFDPCLDTNTCLLLVRHVAEGVSGQ